MKLRLLVRACVVAAAVFTTPASTAQFVADAYQRAPAVEPAQVVPRWLLRSGHHRFGDELELDGHTLRFVIESEFGTYRVRSLPLALIRVREINVLAQAIDHFRRSNVKLAGELRGRLEVGAESFVDILTSPLSTTGNIVGQFTRNVGKTFDEFGEFPDPGEGGATGRAGDSAYLRYQPGDPILAAHRRSVARQLGLDVYSSNPRVQEFLDTVATARSHGRSSAGVLDVSRDRARAAIAGGRVDESVAATLARRGIRELYLDAESRLRALGIDDDLLHRFLSHPALSPRHRAAIVAYLEFLDGVDGRQAILEATLHTRDEVAALGQEQAARLLARYHDSIAPLRRIVDAGEVLVAVDTGSRLVAAVPFDLIYWDRNTDQTFGGLARFATERGYGGPVLLATGVLTDRARRQLEDRGFTLHEHFLLAP